MAAARKRGSGKRSRALQWYRVVIKTRTQRSEVLPSRAGRFHENMETEPTTYAADTVETVWREIAAHLGAIPANPAAFRLYRLAARNLRLVDLGTASERKRYRITEEELRSDPPSPRCQAVAKTIRDAGYDGVLYPSVRNPPDGRCVVLFLEHVDARLVLEPADQEWEHFIGQGRL
jgi:RES domain